MGKKNVLHDAAGKKILHPAEAMNRKAKKKKLEKFKGFRHQKFEAKMLERSPEDILLEIQQLKYDHKRKQAAKIDIHKHSLDRLKQLEVGYERLKDKVEENHTKRQQEQKSSMHIDFEELKVHRKASIYYHPVNNPYGAPPSGQTLMYRHPDGSVKREPPPLDAQAVADAKMSKGDGSSDESGSSGSDEESDEEDAVPTLPDFLPGCMTSEPSSSIGPGLPPMPPGAPPLPAGQPPLPSGAPPLPLGQPPLPMGQPPLSLGQPPLPFGQPPLPLGQPPMPLGQTLPVLGQPPLPFSLPMGTSPGSDMSQAAFMADLANAGFQLPGLPPGPPPKPKPATPTTGTPPGPPPKPKAKLPPQEKAPGPPAKAATDGGLPAGAKPPPPPPKKPAIAAATRAANMFMPTTLRTKKPSQVAGGVLQATSSSLSMDKRKNLLATEVPRVREAVNVDDAFQDFMSELGET